MAERKQECTHCKEGLYSVYVPVYIIEAPCQRERTLAFLTVAKSYMDAEARRKYLVMSLKSCTEQVAPQTPSAEPIAPCQCKRTL